MKYIHFTKRDDIGDEDDWNAMGVELNWSFLEGFKWNNRIMVRFSVSDRFVNRKNVNISRQCVKPLDFCVALAILN